MQPSSILSVLTILAPLVAASAAKNASVALEFGPGDFCKSSTFIGETSGGSPHWLHCLQIRNNIAGRGDWRLALGQYRDIATWGDCKFVAKTDSAWGATIGTEDVRDILWDAINRFRSADRIGARGTVQCTHDAESPNTVDVDWWIWRT